MSRIFRLLLPLEKRRNAMAPKAVLFLVRHAQSENNANPDSLRIPDPGITDLGRQQSLHLASRIDRYAPTLLYCSPFLRTLQTVVPVVERTGIQPRIRQDLFEQGGCYSGHEIGKRTPEKGLPRSKIRSLYPGWQIDERIGEMGWNQLEYYETIELARERARGVRKWYESQMDVHANHRVLMMIHADFKIRLLEAMLEIEDLDPLVSEPINTSVSCLFFQNNRWKLHYWNDFHHLPESLVTH